MSSAEAERGKRIVISPPAPSRRLTARGCQPPGPSRSRPSSVTRNTPDGTWADTTTLVPSTRMDRITGDSGDAGSAWAKRGAAPRSSDTVKIRDQEERIVFITKQQAKEWV